MKKSRLILSIMILILSLTACGKKEEWDLHNNTILQESNSVEETPAPSSEESAIDINESLHTESIVQEPAEEPTIIPSEQPEENTESQIIPIDRGMEMLNMDYKNGIISTDEFVRYNLYNIYNDSRLESDYESTLNTPIDIHRLVDEHIEELSKETLLYYWEKISLKDLIACEEEDLKEEASGWMKGFKNPFVLDVQAAGNEDALDQVLVSSNGNFVVWYATKGKYAITYDDAYAIGENLEKAVIKYEELTGNKYTFQAKTYSIYKGFFYNSLKIILRRNNYDKSYLENAMQVYVADLEDYPASYNAGPSTKVAEAVFAMNEIDQNGSPIFPYILVNSKIANSEERTMQVCCHELFHHGQWLLTNNQLICNDSLISEATANWFSAKTLNVIEGSSFLNEHASSMISFSDKIFTYVLDKYDSTTIGYLFFPYLQLYEKHVDNSIEKIIGSISQENGLAYLESQSTLEERIAIMKDLTMHNLEQSPTNGITLGSPYKKSTPPIASEITADKKDGIISVHKNIQQLHVDYHQLTFNPDWLKYDDFLVKYSFSENSDNIGNTFMYVIGAKEQENKTTYSLISSHQFHSETLDHQLSAETCREYDKIYFAVSNASMTTTCHYSLNVNMENVIRDTTEETTEPEEIIFENEEDEYYYNMAVSVKSQIEEFFTALKSGDIETLKKYSKNVNDDFNDDTIYPALDLECMPQILRILCKDVQFYFSDDMLMGLADDLKEQYENGDNYIYVNIPYTIPIAWYTTEMYVSSFEKGDIAQEPIIETEQEALDIIEEISAMVPMACYDSLYIVLPEPDSDDNISININHIIENYNMPEPEYDIYFDDGNAIYKVEQTNSDDYYNNYLILLGQNMAPYIFDKIPGCPDEYTDKETWELLENYLYNMDLEGLQSYLFGVLEDSACDELYNTQAKYGIYADLNATQKEYVNNCLSKHFDFRVDDFTCIRRNKEERVGCFYISAPIFEYIMNNEKFTKCSEDMLKWSMDNNINYMKHMDFYTDVSLEWTYDMLKEFLIEAYYPLIGYAKNNVQ